MHKTLKRVSATIIWIAFITNCSAQQTGNDSFQLVLSSISQPLQRFDIIRKELEKGNGYSNNTDSSLCIQLLSIAQQLKKDSLFAISYNWIGAYFAFDKGDNISALEYFFKGIPLAEKANDKRRISSLYFDISQVYEGLQNYKTSFDYTIKGGENLPDQSSPLYNFMLVQYQNNLCSYYLDIHKADSALYYAKLGSETSDKIGIGLYYISSICFTGAAYALENDTANADIAFNKALIILPTVKLNSLKSLFYDKYINFLIHNFRLEQAKIFCRQFLALGNTYNSNPNRLLAVGYLRQVFETLHQTDSAYYYSRQESKINRDIFSEGNINRIQALSFHEKLRNIEAAQEQTAYKNLLKEYTLAACLFFFILIGILLYRNNRQKQKANTILEKTLSDLKQTQTQLIQSEKMASLGELTAGIAHEIQNPLNFVNNFSEVSTELLAEMKIELDAGKFDDAKDIANDVIQNLEKINHHGKRADAIVKGMLQHSRSSSGVKEPTDINALADEYLRLSYHGLRAKDNSFNATFKTDFDESIEKINIIPQDIGRVILNLYNNAFYAVQQKQKEVASKEMTTFEKVSSLYEPAVSVSTKKYGNRVEIRVSDNGNGIPEKVVDKIFQPFFTTKPTGQGTGLGLSLSYDIIKAHGGEIKIATKEDEGTTFIIQLPIV
jgi:two-component system NtrC family sensor kinase